jgi:hypothetical protein
VRVALDKRSARPLSFGVMRSSSLFALGVLIAVSAPSAPALAARPDNGDDVEYVLVVGELARVNLRKDVSWADSDLNLFRSFLYRVTLRCIRPVEGAYDETRVRRLALRSGSQSMRSGDVIYVVLRLHARERPRIEDWGDVARLEDRRNAEGWLALYGFTGEFRDFRAGTKCASSP